MPAKKSVRLVDETIKKLAALSKSIDPESNNNDNINWSGAINHLSERYSLFCENCLPELTDCEKKALAQAYNGHLFGRGIAEEIKTMHWQVGESIEFDSNVVAILAQEDINPAAFLEKVKGWKPEERLAVIHLVNEFWSKPITDD
ncbi:hypothetical protein [Agarilytica rhodophyticola]|uniref:hypothetical protein n=1 Tax=Agarilytica rhodophyticola TaxID=1737490 RepID=UPI000B343B6C|nr:hypothetical protein [Agarilytica rhodophyticola]